MIKAIFIDFYGTVVFEDGEVIQKITQEIYDTGKAENKAEIGGYWWKEFQTAFLNSYGESFETQRNLEYRSLAKTIEHYQSTADAKSLSDRMYAYWQTPPIFEESKQFFEACPVPIYVVSNIDREDILAAIEYHGLKPQAVFTSEDAKSYKPRKELFELALNATGLKADDVIHIGDSLSSDVKGAYEVGIQPIWVNRGGREVPKGVKAVSNLMDILQYFG
ncbi:MAG: HAD family hydrolase [Lachnospiraceae bacterium]|nr:HAD family hydrolase [Lachnospiraceae bacterium]